MLTSASTVAAGSVIAIDNSVSGASWTIEVSTRYIGEPPQRMRVHSDRPIEEQEIAMLRGRSGILMVDAKGNLIRRTGSISVTDFFLSVTEPFSAAKDHTVAFCADWMRALTNPTNLLVRDLAIAAAYCGTDPGRAAAVRRELASSGRRTDQLAAILTWINKSDPDGIVALESWLDRFSADEPALVENIAWSLYGYASPDPVGSAALKRIALHSKVERFRHAAVTVLVYIHTDETWNDLSALLESPKSRGLSARRQWSRTDGASWTASKWCERIRQTVAS